MSGRFEIVENKGIYTFELIAYNSERVLYSEEFNSAASCIEAILTLQENAAYESRFEKRSTHNQQYYFLIRQGNGKIIATSSLFWSANSRDYTILVVKRECSCAVIVEH